MDIGLEMASYFESELAKAFTNAMQLLKDCGIDLDLIPPSSRDELTVLQRATTGNEVGWSLPIWDKHHQPHRIGLQIWQKRAQTHGVGAEDVYRDVLFHAFRRGLYTPPDRLIEVKDHYDPDLVGPLLEERLWYPGGHWRGVRNILVDGLPGTSKTTGFTPALIEAILAHDPTTKFIIRVRNRSLGDQIEAQLRDSDLARFGVRRLSQDSLKTCSILVATPELSAYFGAVVEEFPTVLIDEEAHDTTIAALTSNLILDSSGKAGAEANINLFQKPILYVAITGTPTPDLGAVVKRFRGPFDLTFRATYNPYEGRPATIIRGACKGVSDAIEYLLRETEPETAQGTAIFAVGRKRATNLYYRLTSKFPSQLLLTGDTSKGASAKDFTTACGTADKAYPFPKLLVFNTAAAAGNNPPWGIYPRSFSIYDLPRVVRSHQFYQGVCRARGAEETYCWLTTPTYRVPKTPAQLAEIDRAKLTRLDEALKDSYLKAAIIRGVDGPLAEIHYQQRAILAATALVSDRLVTARLTDDKWAISTRDDLAAAHPLLLEPPKSKLKALAATPKKTLLEAEPLPLPRYRLILKGLRLDKTGEAVPPSWAPTEEEFVRFTKTQILDLTHEGSRLYERLVDNPKDVWRFQRYRELSGFQSLPLRLEHDLPGYPAGSLLRARLVDPDVVDGARRLFCTLTVQLPDQDRPLSLPSVVVPSESRAEVESHLLKDFPVTSPHGRLIRYFKPELLAHLQAGSTLMKAIQKSVGYNPETLRVWLESRLYLEVRDIISQMEATEGPLMGEAIYHEEALTPRWLKVVEALEASETVMALSGALKVNLTRNRLGHYLWKAAGYVPHSFLSPSIPGQSRVRLATVVDPELQERGQLEALLDPESLEPAEDDDWPSEVYGDSGPD